MPEEERCELNGENNTILKISIIFIKDFSFFLSNVATYTYLLVLSEEQEICA